MCTDAWFVNKDIGIWYTFILIPLINESNSSVVESLTHNPLIGGSNPSRNYFHFQYRVKWILFPPKKITSHPLISISYPISSKQDTKFVFFHSEWDIYMYIKTNHICKSRQNLFSCNEPFNFQQKSWNASF